VAGIELDGRYPEDGYALNTISKELIYVKSGMGVLTVSNQEVPLHPGDAALVQPNEKYYLKGTLELVVSCAPAWKPEQHRHIST